MLTPPDSTLTPSRECPLHAAMRELAQLATAQHVFYLEGECLPRPDLQHRLQMWARLHEVLSSRLCTATRDTPLSAEELERTLESLRSIPSRMRYLDTAVIPDHSPHNSLTIEETEEFFERTLAMSRACALATSCPLHENAGAGIGGAASGLLP
jgi:hypothetical protein